MDGGVQALKSNGISNVNAYVDNILIGSERFQDHMDSLSLESSAEMVKGGKFISQSR